MKRVLSIDWDYFQHIKTVKMLNKYPDGIDLPTFISEVTWGSHYATDGDEIKTVSILEKELEALIKIINNQDKNIPVMIANSHLKAYHFIKTHLHGKEKTTLLNVDMHHDLVNGNERIDCGNWIGKLVKENKICKHSLGWIHNPISFRMYGFNHNKNDEFHTYLKHIDKGESLDAIKDEKYDLLFIARSDTWSPPHLDRYFDKIVKTVIANFTDIRIEKQVSEPRTQYKTIADELSEQTLIAQHSDQSIERILDEAHNNGNNIYVATDWHVIDIDHKNPNRTVTRKDYKTIIENINRKVKPDDVLLYLGDLMENPYRNRHFLKKFISEIKCRVVMLIGNNDSYNIRTYRYAGIEACSLYAVWENILFTHLPVNNKYEYNIHGHLHIGQSYSKDKEYWTMYGVTPANHINAYSQNCNAVLLDDLIVKGCDTITTKEPTSDPSPKTLRLLRLTNTALDQKE